MCFSRFLFLIHIRLLFFYTLITPFTSTICTKMRLAISQQALRVNLPPLPYFSVFFSVRAVIFGEVSLQVPFPFPFFIFKPLRKGRVNFHLWRIPSPPPNPPHSLDPQNVYARTARSFPSPFSLPVSLSFFPYLLPLRKPWGRIHSTTSTGPVLIKFSLPFPLSLPQRNPGPSRALGAEDHPHEILF